MPRLKNHGLGCLCVCGAVMTHGLADDKIIILGCVNRACARCFLWVFEGHRKQWSDKVKRDQVAEKLR